MRYSVYYNGYCPEFQQTRDIELDIDEEFLVTTKINDRKIMSYRCWDYSECKQIDKSGECPIYLQAVKKTR